MSVKLGLAGEYHWLKIFEKKNEGTKLEKIGQLRAQWFLFFGKCYLGDLNYGVWDGRVMWHAGNRIDIHADFSLGILKARASMGVGLC